MGTMEGLSVPIYGAFYKYSADQTQAWYVEDNGTFNMSLTSPGADNYFAVVVTDTSTVTSGYLQNIYASMSTTGSYTTGSTQINAFAVDLTLGGTVGCEAEGMYIYVSGSSTPTLTDANISGLVVNIANLQATPSSRSGIQIHIEDGNNAASHDAFILMRLDTASGAVTNMFEKAGTTTNPTYFLNTNATDGMIVAGDFLSSAATAYGLAVYVGGAVRYIPLITAS